VQPNLVTVLTELYTYELQLLGISHYTEVYTPQTCAPSLPLGKTDKARNLMSSQQRVFWNTTPRGLQQPPASTFKVRTPSTLNMNVVRYLPKALKDRNTGGQTFRCLQSRHPTIFLIFLFNISIRTNSIPSRNNTEQRRRQNLYLCYYVGLE